MLTMTNQSENVYFKNCQFIGILLKKIISINIEKKLTSSSQQIQLFTELFKIVTGLIDDKFVKRELGKKNKLYEIIWLFQVDKLINFFHIFSVNLRSLLYLLEIITQFKQIICDNEQIIIIINKLLYLIVAIKSLAQSGSYFNKLCLITVQNLMTIIYEKNENDVDDNHNKIEIKLERKFIRFLSGLCGHNDYEIRTLSWCLLLKLSKTLTMANYLIKELSYLPGGFHACCLSTFLDTGECSIVRETAGYLFSNLIAYYNPINNVLRLEVKPICLEKV